MTKLQKDKVSAMVKANKEIWQRARILAGEVSDANVVQARRFLGTQPEEVKVLLDGKLDKRNTNVRLLIDAFTKSLSKDTRKPGLVKKRKTSATNGQVTGTVDGSYQILDDLKDLAGKHGLVELDRGLTMLKELQIV